MREAELVIIGAGPAGLAAAASAVRHGVRVTLIDDNDMPGGQYFRQLPASFRRRSATIFDKEQGRAAALLRVLQDPLVEHLPETTVWDAPEERVLAYAGPHGADRLRAALVLVCAGAHDRPVPFPGWTLPGVVTAGGVQNLVKGFRMVPGRRAVVAGNGPLLLVAAASLIRGGARVAEVVEAAPVGRRWPAQLGRLVAAPAILRLALEYRALLWRHRARWSSGHTVIEAQGEDALRAVVVAPIDAAGRIDRGRARTIAADTLVAGFGLRPSIELFQLMGCALRHAPLRGGWLPERSADLETSRPGVLAAGDGAAIGGVELALAEGALAGLVAAERLGRLGGDAARAAQRPLRARLARLERFRDGLERLYAPPSDYLGLIRPDTVVCRCEEITAGELAERQAEGFTSATALKGATRIGMGRCQGRNCQPTLAALVARSAGIAPAEVAMPRSRQPARPVLIGDLLAETLPDPVLPADPHLPRGESTL